MILRKHSSYRCTFLYKKCVFLLKEDIYCSLFPWKYLFYFSLGFLYLLQN